MCFELYKKKIFQQPFDSIKICLACQRADRDQKRKTTVMCFTGHDLLWAFGTGESNEIRPRPVFTRVPTGRYGRRSPCVRCST